MNETRRLWIVLAVILLVSFSILLLMGREIYRVAPPLPDAVVTTQGNLVYSKQDIQEGRQVWQSMGGQQIGSIWGHGGYLAPDWSADWLHREAVALLDIWALSERGVSFGALDSEVQAGLERRLQTELRENTYSLADGRITISPDRAAAIAAVAGHYDSLFSSDPDLAALRENYALHENPIPDRQRREKLSAFFFWTAWAAVTERPGGDVSYTGNWPADELVGNQPTAPTFLWTFVSIILLIAAVGALVWYHASLRRQEPPTAPEIDPLHSATPTPSMRATLKYFWVVTALFALQVVLGAVTAHYAVEGQAFYGFQLSELLPYVLTRTWHTQLAVLWIATSWLATGLYIAPLIGGREPRFQRLGVNFLFSCLLIIVLGSMAGQWLGVMQKLGLDVNFWLGHQGWEYVDLGRFWQAFLFVGLLVWLTLVGRGLWPALKRRDDARTLTLMLFLSTVAIAVLYGAGLMWGKHTHLSMVEYWRWWVVHLWVEGFFEVFATAVIALLFTRLGLVRFRTANVAVLFATIVFLTGGVLGTFHHLYFAGTPTAVLALGATFSALEVVPLVLIGFEAYENYRLGHARKWVSIYRWPIMFFLAVAFWNLVGAGVFGFLINPPLALYYMQGLNTTPLHGHTALFGVYGMLGIGLMLFCLRGLDYRKAWSNRLLATSFWSLNVGLAAMALLSLLPYGLMQVWASVTHGLWYARSAEFIQQPVMDFLIWMRMPGVLIFMVGVACLVLFVAGLAWPRGLVSKPAAVRKTGDLHDATR
jgi:nitric oxide reductase subunit B